MSELFSPENLSEYVAFFQRHYMICGGWIVVLCVFVYMQIKIMTSKVKKASSNLATILEYINFSINRKIIKKCTTYDLKTAKERVNKTKYYFTDT